MNEDKQTPRHGCQPRGGRRLVGGVAVLAIRIGNLSRAGQIGSGQVLPPGPPVPPPPGSWPAGVQSTEASSLSGGVLAFLNSTCAWNGHLALAQPVDSNGAIFVAWAAREVVLDRRGG